MGFIPFEMAYIITLWVVIIFWVNSTDHSPTPNPLLDLIGSGLVWYEDMKPEAEFPHLVHHLLMTLVLV